ncbi:MAG TPA: hypothetical protein ENN03_09690 [bacterium]|nr:hypothetical protein [bacterium]
MIKDSKQHILKGRRLYIPRMSTEAASALAAAFRSVGVDACISPESDARTLDLASRFTNGEECLPQRVTLGNFLKIVQGLNFDPRSTAFFLPTSSGPCRFGQYRNLLRKVLDEAGAQEARIFSPTSSNGYAGIADRRFRFLVTVWRALILSDSLRKARLMIRPYEAEKGLTDSLHNRFLGKACRVLGDPDIGFRRQRRECVKILQSAAEAFESIPLKEKLGSRPLIGVVGEIYLRFNEFSNQHMLRSIENQGGEVWIANIAEWAWYTNYEEERKLREAAGIVTFEMARVRLRRYIQETEEKALTRPLRKFFRSRPETPVPRLLEYSRPYLPAHKALGEMTLNAGNAVAFYHAGCDGVVDISPFTCMNGIVSEVVYPRISRDHEQFPIRIFYFDGVPFDLTGHLEIFMEQAGSYRRRRLEKSRRGSRSGQ